MALALEARAMKDDIMLGDTPKARNRRGKLRDVQTRGRLWKHATLADLDGLVTSEELPGLFIFTLVRNPWDRLLSYYSWLRAQSFDHASVARAQGHDFAGFLNHPHTKAEFLNHPASSYMRDAAGAERCDLYIRLEHFAQDAVTLEQHLGFALEMPHVNRSARKAGYQGAYTPDLRDLVAEICAEDIERFGYTF